MKHHRRALALFMAAILLLSSTIYTLPVLASPGVPLYGVTVEPASQPTGDGVGYTSAFADNHWLYDEANRAITYRGGWTAGYMTAEGYFAFTHINSSNNTWLTKDTTDQWQSPAGTIERNSLQMRAAHGEGYATAMAYTVPASGTVTFSLDTYVSALGESFAIFVGQRMVYPNNGIAFEDANDRALWFTTNNMYNDINTINAALQSVTASVEAGETVAFAFRGYSSEGYTTDGYHIVRPRVTYLSTRAPAIESSRINVGGENYPTYTRSNGQFSLKSNFTGGWSFGSLNCAGNRPYEAFTKLNASTGILTRGGSDQVSYGGLALTTGAVTAVRGVASAFTYEATLCGRVDLRVNNISLGTGAEAVLFCILKNGEMLWPTAGGSLTRSADWYELTAEGASITTDAGSAEALQGVAVSAGDKIQFCFTAKTGHNARAKDVDLTVSYTAISSSIPHPSTVSTSLSENYPILRSTTAGGGLLAYRGRWQYAAAKRGTADFTRLTKTNAENAFLPGAEKAEGYLSTTYRGGSAAGLCPGTAYDIAVQYTVRYSGSATLTPGILNAEGGERYTLALLKNGTPVAAAKTGTAAELAATAFPLTVSAGDVLTLSLSRPEGERGEAPLYMAPALAYEKVTDRAVVTGASMALSSDLSIRFYTAAAVSYPEAREHGLLVWHEGEREADAVTLTGEPTKENTCTYVYTGLSAKQMGDTVLLRPYVITAEGERVEGEVTRFSILDYATALYGTSTLRDRMLTDLLLYGAAAQEYFSYRTDRLVTAGLTEAQLACSSRESLLFAGCTSVSPEESTIITGINAFSLLLENSLTLRVYAENYDEAEVRSLFLEVSTTPDFTGAQRIRMKNGVADVSGIPFGEVGRTYYLRMSTGAYGKTRYSPVVTYSVESYIANTSALENERLTALNEALLAFGNSARIYAYEREQAMAGA